LVSSDSLRGERPANLFVDVQKLRVAVRVIVPFLGLPIPLQAIVHLS